MKEKSRRYRFLGASWLVAYKDVLRIPMHADRIGNDRGLQAEEKDALASVRLSVFILIFPGSESQEAAKLARNLNSTKETILTMLHSARDL